jgi:multiple sugar transport system substrate-binding protein
MKALRYIFAMLVIASMLLTACKAATPEAPPEEPEEEIVITFWHQEAVDTRVKILQELLDEFYEETGIMVVQETMTWGEQFVKLMSAIEAGNPPDITWGTEGTAVTLLEAGAIVPMTEIVEEIDGMYQYVEAHRDRVFWSGEYWAVPVFALSYNYWYRADMFQEAGLDVPETWDEVLAAAEALNDPPNRWGIALPTGETMYGDQVMTNIMLGHGGTVMAKGNELVVNSPEMVNALAMFNQLAQFTPPDAGNYTWPEAGQAFAQGKAAQLITFNAVLDYASVETNVPENLGIAQMPHAPGYESATSAATLCIMMITDDPVKQEAIKTWFLWMLEPDNYGRFAAGFEPGLFLPITAAGLESETYWAHEKIAPYADQVRRALELTAINKNTAWVTGDVPDPFAGTIYNAFPLIKAAQMVLFEGATPEEGAAEAERIIKETLGWD